MEDTLKDLIAIQSTSDRPEKLQEVLSYIEDKIPFWVHQKFSDNNKPSLIISNVDGLEFDIILACHLDVVPGNDEMFKPFIKENRLYGRGSVDMKFAATVFIKLLNEIKNVKDIRIATVFTTDEEIGGFNGINYLVNQGLKSKVVILPDGGADMTISHAEKGVLHLRITAKGKSAHGSRPWLGNNAIDNLIDYYIKVRKEFNNPEGEAWVTTVNAGKINGGNAVNSVADFATLDLDFRYPTRETRQKILDTLDKFKNDDISIDILTESYPSFIDEDNVYLKEYIEVCKEILNEDPELIKSAGSSDARFFSAVGIPVIVSRPKGTGHHSNEEWIDLDSLNQYYQIVKQFVLSDVFKTSS